MKNIRWGILSTGKIAHMFAKALQTSEGTTLYAVSSRSVKKAEVFAKEYGFSNFYGSTEEMLRDPLVEVIYIASPMACHYSDAMKCLRAGKHVLCEKSVTLNEKQLDDILALAKEKNLFFMEAMWTKTMPHFLQAKQWVDEGKIGAVKMIKSGFDAVCVGNPEDRLFRADLGGGALLDLGVYPLTFSMAFLGNKPSCIHAMAVMKNQVDYDDMVTLQYEDAFATMTFGFDCKSENAATIVGEKGTVMIPAWFHCAETVSLFDADNHLVEERSFPHPRTGYEYEIKEVNRCLRQGLTESPLVPQKDTKAVMSVMDEIRRQIGLRYPEE